jgi:hypothetical protein
MATIVICAASSCYVYNATILFRLGEIIGDHEIHKSYSCHCILEVHDTNLDSNYMWLKLYVVKLWPEIHDTSLDSNYMQLKLYAIIK